MKNKLKKVTLTRLKSFLVVEPDQVEKLQKMMDYEDRYMHQMNIFLNDRSKEWYNEFGEYILKKFRENRLYNFDYMDPDKKPKKKLGPIYLTSLKKKDYSSVAITFITSYLGHDVLKKMWGYPLYHDEFGEGFHDGDDNEPDNPRMYASYFKTINGIKFHIGYDHRGTSVEVEQSPQNQPKKSPEDIMNALKQLVDMCVKSELKSK